MLLKYIICEDGDDQNHPNVFNIASSHASSSSQITLEQVRSVSNEHTICMTIHL